MALYLEKTLYNGTVVRYHRVTGFVIEEDGKDVSAVLESYADANHRAIPTTSFAKEVFKFSWSGSGEALASEAYAHIQALPEWTEAVFI